MVAYVLLSVGVRYVMLTLHVQLCSLCSVGILECFHSMYYISQQLDNSWMVTWKWFWRMIFHGETEENHLIWSVILIPACSVGLWLMGNLKLVPDAEQSAKYVLCLICACMMCQKMDMVLQFLNSFTSFFFFGDDTWSQWKSEHQ